MISSIKNLRRFIQHKYNTYDCVEMILELSSGACYDDVQIRKSKSIWHRHLYIIYYIHNLLEPS